MVMQLIYMSEPFGFDASILAGILTDARRNNRRDGITGALICRQDIYLQMIEGEPGVIDAAFARIAVDNRHLAVTELWRGDVTARLFPDWDMLDDPARSWLWSADEVAHSAVTAAEPHQLRAVFERVAVETGTR